MIDQWKKKEFRKYVSLLKIVLIGSAKFIRIMPKKIWDVENAYLAQTIADGEQTYAADPLTCDWDSLIEELGAPSISSATIYDVTHEAAFDYYGNEIDLDTAVQRIEENLGLYFSEQQ